MADCLQQNLFNLFSVPLGLSEWVVALMLLGSIRVGLMVLFCIPIIYLLLGLNILILWHVLLPAMVVLIVSGFMLAF